MKKICCLFILFLCISHIINAQDCNFKAASIEYTWDDNDSLHVKAYYEIWGGNIMAPIPFEVEWRVNGIPVSGESSTITQLGGGSTCYFSSLPCGGKDCPDISVGPFSFHGDCQDRYVPAAGVDICLCVYLDFKLCAVPLPTGPGPYEVSFVMDPGNVVTEFVETDNTISTNIEAINLKPTSIEYTWGTNDTIHLKANYEIWDGSITTPVPLVGEWQVNGIPVSRETTLVAPLGGPCSCPFSSLPCPGKDCPDLGIGPLTLHGDCQDRYVPVLENDYCFCVYIDFQLSAAQLSGPGPYQISFVFDPDNNVSELDETDNTISTEIEALNFKPTSIEYTWGTNDTIHLKANYEIWDGNITSPVNLVGEWQVNGIPVSRETTLVAPLGGACSCPFTSLPCGGKDCPDISVGPFSFHGDCQDRYVPVLEDDYCFCVYIDFKLSAMQLPPAGGPYQITFVLDPDNSAPELDETDNTVSTNIEAINFKPTSIEYTWGTNDTIHVQAYYEIWDGSITTPVPLVGELQINGITVGRDSANITPLGGPCSCPFTSLPCGGKDCPDLGVSYFTLHGDCQDRYVPVLENDYCFCVYLDFNLSSVQLPPEPGPYQLTFIMDPDNYTSELDETDNTISTEIEALNFKPTSIEYTWGTNDTIHLKANYEIWDGNITSPVNLVGEWQVNGIPVSRETTLVAPLGGACSCPFTSLPCGGKDCPDISVGPFSFHGDCQDRYVPVLEDDYCFCVYLDFKLSAMQLPPAGGPYQITFVLDPDNSAPELVETDNTVSTNIEAINFKPTSIEYTLGIDDTIHLKANYEIWDGSITSPVPLVGEWQVNGIPVSSESGFLTPLGGPCSCPFSSLPCPGKDCPDLGIGPFTLHGDCQDRYVPVLENDYCFCVYIDFKLSAMQLPPAGGPYQITFVLDPYNAAPELVETDNSVTVNIGATDIELIMSKSWNLVSVPSVQLDWNAEVIFPGKQGDMYSYNTATGGYIAAPILANGPGYWVNYATGDTIMISGDPPTSPGTSADQAGWVLVGSREITIDVASLILSDGAVINGSAYRYNPISGNYEATIVIDPGDGVWINVSKACTITIP